MVSTGLAQAPTETEVISEKGEAREYAVNNTSLSIYSDFFQLRAFSVIT